MVFAFRVVEEFDVIEDVASCVVSGVVCLTPDAFSFQQVKKALDNRVVHCLETLHDHEHVRCTETLEMALQASVCDGAKVAHKPRLLSDNGSSYVSGDLAEWLSDKGMNHVCGAPYHP